MAWNVFAILEPGEESNGLYPSISDQLSVTHEILDGQIPSKIDVGILEAERQGATGLTKVASVADVKVEIYPTASRLIIYCLKWTKGGFVGSTGGIGLAVALTTAVVSSAHSARKRKDKVLAGHIRWEWVSAIGWRARSFWQRNEVVIRFVDATDGKPTTCHLVLAFRPGANSQALAREMTDKVIAYRYAGGETFGENELAEWESLRTSGMSPKVDKGISWLTMPSSWEVGRADFPASSVVPRYPAPAARGN
jgi:hypothetical protein